MLKVMDGCFCDIAAEIDNTRRHAQRGMDDAGDVLSRAHQRIALAIATLNIGHIG